MLRKRYSMNVSYKIFSGWDFTIQDPDSALLKRGCIRNDLKVNLAATWHYGMDKRRFMASDGLRSWNFGKSFSLTPSGPLTKPNLLINMQIPHVTLSLKSIMGPMIWEPFVDNFNYHDEFPPFVSHILSIYVVHEFSCISLSWTSAAPGGAAFLHACSSEEARTKGAALPAEVLPKCARLVSAERSLLPHLLCNPYKRKGGESVNLHILPKSFSNLMFNSGFWICAS